MATPPQEILVELTKQFNSSSHPQDAIEIAMEILQSTEIEDVNKFVEGVNPNLTMQFGMFGPFLQSTKELFLFGAAKVGHLDVMKNLVQMQGVDVNSPIVGSILYHMESFPSEAAASEGFVDCLKYLLERGADVNPSDARRPVPLWWAVQHGQLECVKLLLEHKADVNCAHAPLSFHNDSMLECVL